MRPGPSSTGVSHASRTPGRDRNTIDSILWTLESQLPPSGSHPGTTGVDPYRQSLVKLIGAKVGSAFTSWVDEDWLRRHSEALPNVPEGRTDTAIVGEIGVDMSRFPTARHLASWAGMCPGNNESAGKRKSGKTTKGSPYLRTALVQVAWAASHSKGTYLAAQFHQLGIRAQHPGDRSCMITM